MRAIKILITESLDFTILSSKFAGRKICCQKTTSLEFPALINCSLSVL